MKANQSTRLEGSSCHEVAMLGALATDFLERAADGDACALAVGIRLAAAVAKLCIALEQAELVGPAEGSRLVAHGQATPRAQGA